jgi:hypothetical protein
MRYERGMGENTEVHDVISANGTVVYDDICCCLLARTMRITVARGGGEPHAQRATAFHWHDD